MQKIQAAIEGGPHLPFWHLATYVHGSLLLGAPERHEKIVEDLEGVSLKLTEQNSWVAHYSRQGPEIVVSWRTVETLWCVSYAMVVLMDRVLAESPNTHLPQDLTADSEVRAAMELLRWALDDLLNGKHGLFPTEKLPSRTILGIGTRANAADEVCLCACSFLLHHELSHHRLGHTHSSAGAGDQYEKIDAERDADSNAIDMLLGDVEPTTPFFTKRAAGVAIVTLLMVAQGIHTGNYSGRSHPRSIERLANWPDQYLVDDDHSIWVIISCCLKLHFDNSMLIAAPAGMFGSYRECAQAYFDQLAEHAEKAEAAKATASSE